MTDRFTLTFDDKIVDNLTGIIHDVHSGYDVAMDLSGLLNVLNDENEQLKSRCDDYDTALKRLQDLTDKKNKEIEELKQALKNSYINEICENCKHGHYWISETFGYGLEGEFKCTKKHFGNDHWKCDGLTECDDFELKIER